MKMKIEVENAWKDVNNEFSQDFYLGYFEAKAVFRAFFMINLYAFNICDTLKHNGFVIDFIDFIYVLSSIDVIEI